MTTNPQSSEKIIIDGDKVSAFRAALEGLSCLGHEFHNLSKGLNKSFIEPEKLRDLLEAYEDEKLRLEFEAGKKYRQLIDELSA